MTEIYEMDGFLTSLTDEQVQTNIDQTIDLVQTGKPLTITQDGQAAACCFPSKKAQNCSASAMQRV